jgi:hypothetical protein
MLNSSHMYLRSILIIVLAMLFGSALPAQAKAIRLETQKSSTPNGKPAAALIINGETVLQLAKDQHGQEPLRNVSIIAARLAEAFRSGQFKLVIAEGAAQRSFNLLLNDEVLVTASDMEGKAWGAEPKVLAETWRKNIETALASEFAAGTPLLSPDLPEPEPREPLGTEAGQVKFVFEHAPAAPDSPPEPATPAPAPARSGGIIDLSSAGTRDHPDYDGLIITSGNVVYQPPSNTQYTGGELPGTGTVRVTGKKPSAEMLSRAIDNALRLKEKLSPADKLNWAPAERDAVIEAPPGATTSLDVKYTAAGRPEAATTLKLENRALATPREAFTYFSNRPERIDKEQLLYYAELPERQAARLVYHHQLARSQDLRLIARVINTGSEPGAVYVVPGDANADVNTFYVGYLSAETFWKNLNRGNGYVASLPPGGQHVLIEHRLTGGETGSGYYKLVNLGGGPLLVETLALNPGVPIPNQPLEGRGPASGAVYGPPYYAISESYACGDPWKYLRLGGDKPASLTDDTTLDGCYGMTHSYSIELSNPLGRPALVFVVLRGSAGEVKGQFYIDDEYVGTPLVKGGDEQLLKEIPLKPGETKLLKIAAIPLNGGFYPASIILRESRYP